MSGPPPLEYLPFRFTSRAKDRAWQWPWCHPANTAPQSQHPFPMGARTDQHMLFGERFVTKSVQQGLKCRSVASMGAGAELGCRSAIVLGGPGHLGLLVDFSLFVDSLQWTIYETLATFNVVVRGGGVLEQGSVGNSRGRKYRSGPGAAATAGE